MILSAAVLCLAANIYHEARDQDVQGQALVAQVTLNRVDSHKYPDSVCEVVYQYRTMDDGREVAQFSWTKDGRSDKMKNAEARAIAEAIALDVLSGAERATDALHYHAVSVSPYWVEAYTLDRVHGDHVFYLD